MAFRAVKINDRATQKTEKKFAETLPKKTAPVISFVETFVFIGIIVICVFVLAHD